MIGSPPAAEDVTQEAFLCAFRSVGRFRDGVFRSWLLRIASNACIDELRRRSRRPQTSLDLKMETEGDAAEVVDGSPLPEDVALRKELQSHLQASLLRLPLEQRSAVVLCDVQGMGYEEIAGVLGISVGTVKSRISRGRARLRSILQERAELLPPRFRHRE